MTEAGVLQVCETRAEGYKENDRDFADVILLYIRSGIQQRRSKHISFQLASFPLLSLEIPRRPTHHAAKLCDHCLLTPDLAADACEQYYCAYVPLFSTSAIKLVSYASPPTRFPYFSPATGGTRLFSEPKLCQSDVLEPSYAQNDAGG
jgi:hypothetical protein